MSISDDLGIYIGSATAYGCIRKRGIVFCEPALVAVEPETGRILNAGFEAEELLKHAKIHSRGVYPLADGSVQMSLVLCSSFGSVACSTGFLVINSHLTA